MFWRTRGRPMPDLEPDDRPAPAPAPAAAPEASGWSMSPLFKFGPVRRLAAMVILAFVGAIAASMITGLQYQAGMAVGAIAGAFLPEVAGMLGFAVKVIIVLAILALAIFWYVTNFMELPVWFGG